MKIMSATKKQSITAMLPTLAVPDAECAISIVNGWLHKEVGSAVNASLAIFYPESFCWRLPIQFAYPDTGPLGVIGDVFLRADTGHFLGLPEVEELEERAAALLGARRLTEEFDAQ